MTNHDQENPQGFVVTKGYRRFTEMCDACRRTRVVGLGYGPPGTGKTESAKHYAQWGQIKPFLPESLITFTGRGAIDGFYPYRPFTFATAPWTLRFRSAERCSIRLPFRLLSHVSKKRC